MDADARASGKDPVDPSVLHDVLLELTRAVEDHFGDREPSPQELDAFLKERLLAEGRSEEEAAQILSGLEG